MTKQPMKQVDLLDEYAQLVSIFETISDKFFFEGKLPEAIQLLRRGKQIFSESINARAADHARLLIQFGRILNWATIMGDNHLDEADALLTQAAEIATSINEQSIHAHALLNLGNTVDFRKVYTDEGDWNDAMALIQQAHEIFLSSRDKKGEGESTFFAGLIYQRLGHKEEATTHFNQALKIAKENGDKFKESEAVRHIGAYFFQDRKLNEAARYAESSLRLWQEIDCKIGLPSALHVMGVAQQATGHPDEALASYQQAVHLAEEMNLKVPLVQVLLTLSGIYEKNGQLDLSKGAVERASEIAIAMGYPGFINATENRLIQLRELDDA